MQETIRDQRGRLLPGHSLRRGKGQLVSEADKRKALRALKKAAHQGNAQACGILLSLAGMPHP